MDHTPKERQSIKKIGQILACVLQQLCDRNDHSPFDPLSVTKFHALRPPVISVKTYLDRVAKYAACSPECFVLALIYIDRVIQSNNTFLVNSLNVHRLLITSVMLAAKFFDDQYFNNAYYGKVGGVPTREVNSLETEFLFMVNFNLFVTTQQFEQYSLELRNHARTSQNCDCYTTLGGGDLLPRPLLPSNLPPQPPIQPPPQRQPVSVQSTTVYNSTSQAQQQQQQHKRPRHTQSSGHHRSHSAADPFGQQHINSEQGPQPSSGGSGLSQALAAHGYNGTSAQPGRAGHRTAFDDQNYNNMRRSAPHVSGRSPIFAPTRY